jgi:hypothetical protein
VRRDEAVDHQAEGEVEAVVAGSGGQLGGIALGLREGIGQCGESAQQFAAADDPVVVTVAEPVVYQGDLETIGVDVERQVVDRPGCGLRVEPPASRMASIPSLTRSVSRLDGAAAKAAREIPG